MEAGPTSFSATGFDGGSRRLRGSTWRPAKRKVGGVDTAGFRGVSAGEEDRRRRSRRSVAAKNSRNDSTGHTSNRHQSGCGSFLRAVNAVEQFTFFANRQFE